MKKFLFSLGIIGASIVYAVMNDKNSFSITPPPAPTAPSTPVPVAKKSAPAVASEPVPAPQPVTPPVAVAAAPTPPKSGYGDGSYTGDAADAYYGTVQVEATIRNGKLTDVQFLQYPNDRSTSRFINGQAMPQLTQEAIQVQSSRVDIVSGATETSLAFRQSLASALAQAKN